MADFFQNGVITTLHNLTQRPVEELEAELMSFRHKRPLSLVLPCLYSELEGPAMDRIVEELAQVPYLDQIVIGLDQADEDQYRAAHRFFARLPQKIQLLWNDGPRLRSVDARLQETGLAPDQPGKGRNVWFCFGSLLAQNQTGATALHDCDIVTYERGMLARLLYPVAHPGFNYQFCKGYYARVNEDGLRGRACRLLLTPLLRTLKKIFGNLDYLEFMDSFRYALAGEFSMRNDVLNDLRIPSDWGLEIGVLSEMNRNYSTNRICQVDIADVYDHKHQQLSADDPSTGLSRMSIDITKAIYRKLATHGVVFTSESFRSIKATYYRVALDFIDTYASDAAINGLPLDVHKEEQAVELFAQNIVEAGQTFLDNPMETPFIPSWSRVNSALPGLMEELRGAIAADHAQFAERTG